jgi:hypothetical protein
VLSCLSLLIAHSAPSFLSFPPILTFSLLVPTSKSRHHFSFSCTLSPQVLPVVLGFFDSFPSFLLVCGFVSFTQLYIHPSSFCSQSFRFFTGKPVSSQFHSFSSPSFLSSTFTSSFFFLTYFHRLFIISFISFSLCHNYQVSTYHTAFRFCFLYHFIHICHMYRK